MLAVSGRCPNVAFHVHSEPQQGGGHEHGVVRPLYSTSLALAFPLLSSISTASGARDPHHQKGSKSRRCGMTSVPNRRMERIRSSSAKSPKLNSPKKVLNMPAVAHALSFLLTAVGGPRGSK